MVNHVFKDKISLDLISVKPSKPDTEGGARTRSFTARGHARKDGIRVS